MTRTEFFMCKMLCNDGPADVPEDAIRFYHRAGFNCSRWDSPARRYPGGEFKYGMGVATMDFECAPCITDALAERCKHRTWGYMANVDSLREAIAEECRNLKDPRIGFLTVTGVDTAPDLRNATVFFSVLGGPDEQKETGEALEAAASRIRAAVGEQVRLKYLPQLRFELDPSIAHGERIDAILRDIGDKDDA